MDSEGSGSQSQATQLSQLSQFSLSGWEQFRIGGGEGVEAVIDPDWAKLTTHARQLPGSAHERFYDELIKEGPLKRAALFRKIVHFATTENPADGIPIEVRHQAAVSVIRTILHLTMHHEEGDETMLEMVGATYNELGHFSNPVLKAVGDHCLGYLITTADRDGTLPPRWTELSGRIIALIVSRGDVRHFEELLDGKSYREKVIAQICNMEWTISNSTSLLSLIREIPGLGDGELRQILQKVRSSVLTMRIAGFPAINQQLLQLAGGRVPVELLLAAAEFFTERATETELERRQLRNVMGSTLIQFLEACKFSDRLVSGIGRIIRSSATDFAAVMSPFMLSMALGLADSHHIGSKVIRPLYNSIRENIQMSLLSQTSRWFQEGAGPSSQSVLDCFRGILSNSPPELEIMTVGLVGLGNLLLGGRGHQKRTLAIQHHCQQLGAFIIKSVLRFRPDQLPVVIKGLLSSASESSAYTDCLLECLEMRIRQLIEPGMSSSVAELISHLPRMNAGLGPRIVKVMDVAFQLKRPLLDQLIAVLHKSGWRTLEAQKSFARILIVLLSNTMAVGEIASSHFSQARQPTCPDRLPDAQPPCVEILILARRCLCQHYEIKRELYLGLGTVVQQNPGICELICCQLLSHASRFVAVVDDEPLLDVQQLVCIQSEGDSNTVLILDEIGFLMQAISRVIRSSYQTFARLNEGPPNAVLQLEKLFDKSARAVAGLLPDSLIPAATEICVRAGVSLPLELVRNVEAILLIQALQLIEAHIGQAMADKPGAETDSLLKKYDCIRGLMEEHRKCYAKGGTGKKDKAKKLEEEESCVQLPRTKYPTFCHIFSLDELAELLEREEGEEIMEQLLLDAVTQKFQSFSKGDQLLEWEQGPEELLQRFIRIASQVWKMLNGQPQQMERELGRLELLSLIVGHVSHSNESTRTRLLTELGGNFSEIFSTWKTLMSSTAQPEVIVHLFDILRALSHSLAPDTDKSGTGSEVLYWLWNYMATEQRQLASGVEIADAVLSSWLAFYSKALSSLEHTAHTQSDILSVAKMIRASLGDSQWRSGYEVLEGKKDGQTNLWLINPETAAVALVKIMEFMEDMLAQLGALLGKLGSLWTNEPENHRQSAPIIREKCFEMMNQVLAVAAQFVPSNIPPHLPSTTMLRVISKIFELMGSFAVYLAKVAVEAPSFELIRGFVRPVNFVGQQFQGMAETMINHIEATQREHAERSRVKALQRKGSLLKSAKLGRETGMAPKMVYQIERYGLFIVQLAKRLHEYKGSRLLAGTRLTAARDFKIDGEAVKRAVRAGKRKDPAADSTTDTDD